MQQKKNEKKLMKIHFNFHFFFPRNLSFQSQILVRGASPAEPFNNFFGATWLFQVFWRARKSGFFLAIFGGAVQQTPLSSSFFFSGQID